jgi:para-nitrobenzyl esterase
VRSALALVFAVAAFAMLGSNPAGASVPTQQGPVTGTTLDGMRAFLGIPYAKPPVAALRWQPPLPPIRRPGPLSAIKFANHCPQAPGPFGKASSTEDCLYLNIFTPPRATPRSNLPVMVWIHGGALTVGESDDYIPDRLVAHDVIVVTINYRLGYLGFLAVPALDAEPHKIVNYGFLDQQAALKWVRQNIANFGGDPYRTTIFGESAGGLSVFSQLASPGATGLFDRAIAESGGYQLTLPTLAADEALGTTLATSLGCSGPATAACLRALPVASIIAKEGSLTTPAVDGTILPRSPGEAFETGKFNRVPVIDGSNHDEYRLFTAIDFDLTAGPLTAAEYPAVISATVGAALAPAVLKVYPVTAYTSPDLAFAAAITDATFSCTALAADRALSRFVPVHAYEFVDPNAPELFLPPVSFPYQAAHASELQFLFDGLSPSPHPLSATERGLAARMTAYWTRFAATGQPNDFSTRFWPGFSPVEDDVFTLVPEPPILDPGPSFEKFHHCDFWGPVVTPEVFQAAHAAARARSR